MDNDVDVIETDHSELKIVSANESSVHSRYPWHAKRLIEIDGEPQPNVRNRKT
jgi:hypothetical protein